MDITIHPRKLRGVVHAIPSKSQAHRILICAAFSENETTIVCENTNQDIEATAQCLRALGAEIERNETTYHVVPIKQFPKTATLDCEESGSTLRFLLPIVCALGVQSTIRMHGRLPYRPLSPLWEELERMGCKLSRPTETTIRTEGILSTGTYTIAGNVSSQYISGLLFGLSLLNGTSNIVITGKLESRPYVDMTQQALRIFGVETGSLSVSGSYPFHSPGELHVEGDWSNAAFFLAAKALGSDVHVLNLNENSYQGDRAIAKILNGNEQNPNVDVADIPDLVPILAVYFAATTGVKFHNVSRLRIKESDRICAVIDLLNAVGISAESDENKLTVCSGVLHGGVVDACNDHRIAMAAAIASTVADGPITVLGAECVAKSYPAFWQVFQSLGGCYEQYIR